MFLERLRESATDRGVPLEITEIGRSRQGRSLYGIRLGEASRAVSLTAGAHSDEPVGPMSVLALADWCINTPKGQELLQRFRFHLCPQVNPDGAEANRPWFSASPDPVTYLQRVFRELPGEDIEFGYPAPAELPDAAESLRPENVAVARFLAINGSVVFHASLHGMAVAEGAWFLIGHNWINRTAGLRQYLAESAAAVGLPLHDIDRRGDKGFFRIDPGFSTTPTSAGMRDHFLAKGDPGTAKLFRLNSMEFAQALGGDPLVMVSELPLFLIGKKDPSHDYDPNTSAPASPTLYERFRERLPQVTAELRLGNSRPAEILISQFALRPVPITDQMELQIRMILKALETVE